MKELIKKELNRLLESQIDGPEPKIIGDDGKNERIAQLIELKRMKTIERNNLNSEIKKLEAEIKKWEIDISPNQYTMF